eukprot:166958_1
MTKPSEQTESKLVDFGDPDKSLYDPKEKELKDQNNSIKIKNNSIKMKTKDVNTKKSGVELVNNWNHIIANGIKEITHKTEEKIETFGLDAQRLLFFGLSETQQAICDNIMRSGYSEIIQKLIDDGLPSDCAGSMITAYMEKEHEK